MGTGRNRSEWWRMKCGLVLCCGFFLIAQPTSAEGIPQGVMKSLASDQFIEREKGQEQLRKWAEENIQKAPEALYLIWEKEADPEVKQRCFNVMEKTALLRKFRRGQGFVGIRMERVVIPGEKGGKELQGVRVELVKPGTPGAQAGLAFGDIVLGVDAVQFHQRENINVVEFFIDYIKGKEPDDVITLHILRAGERIEKKITLALRPPELDREFFPFGKRGASIEQQKKDYFSQWLNDQR